mmetsp:Transcript_25630/g.85434  ORF Transcript_25630/g.85434 Transcript_25630/m.85434 type:complete len:235 (-) Transcript_25630:19-723(-)
MAGRLGGGAPLPLCPDGGLLPHPWRDRRGLRPRRRPVACLRRLRRQRCTARHRAGSGVAPALPARARRERVGPAGRRGARARDDGRGLGRLDRRRVDGQRRTRGWHTARPARLRRRPLARPALPAERDAGGAVEARDGGGGGRCGVDRSRAVPACSSSSSRRRWRRAAESGRASVLQRLLSGPGAPHLWWACLFSCQAVSGGTSRAICDVFVGESVCLNSYICPCELCVGTRVA